MGGICQKEFVVNDTPGCEHSATVVFSELGLRKSEINRLYNAFVDIDLDKSGQVRRDELFATLRVESTSFNRRVFRSCDRNNSHEVNFCEFVIAMWDLLSSDPKDVGSVVFYLFDNSHRGILHCDEVRTLVETMHHKSYANNRGVQHEVDLLLATRQSTGLSVDEFVTWSHAHPSILSPALTLQHHLRQCVCGKFFWKRICARRYSTASKTAPNYITGVYELYDLNIFKERMNKQREGIVNGVQRSGTVAVGPEAAPTRRLTGHQVAPENRRPSGSSTPHSGTRQGHQSHSVLVPTDKAKCNGSGSPSLTPSEPRHSRPASGASISSVYSRTSSGERTRRSGTEFSEDERNRARAALLKDIHTPREVVKAMSLPADGGAVSKEDNAGRHGRHAPRRRHSVGGESYGAVDQNLAQNRWQGRNHVSHVGEHEPKRRHSAERRRGCDSGSSGRGIRYKTGEGS